MFDFNNLNKTVYLEVRLPDEEKTKISVTTPTKRILDKTNKALMEINGVEEGKDNDCVESLYDLAEEILNRNKESIVISKEKVVNLLDIEDVLTFLYSYIEFITKLSNQKN